MAAQEFKTKLTFHWALMEPLTLLISKPKPCYLGICAWICMSVRRFSWGIIYQIDILTGILTNWVQEQ